MAKRQRTCEPRPRWPRWWRLVVVAVSTLILCSCRAGGPPPLPDVAAADSAGAERAGSASPLVAHGEGHANPMAAYQGAYAPHSPDGRAAPGLAMPPGPPMPPLGPFVDPA